MQVEEESSDESEEEVRPTSSLALTISSQATLHRLRSSILLVL